MTSEQPQQLPPPDQWPPGIRPAATAHKAFDHLQIEKERTRRLVLSSDRRRQRATAEFIVHAFCRALQMAQLILIEIEQGLDEKPPEGEGKAGEVIDYLEREIRASYRWHFGAELGDITLPSDE